MSLKFRALAVVFLLLTSSAFAAPQSLRWTGADDKNAELSHVVSVINQRAGLGLAASDFLLIEDRSLAHNRYRMYVETAGGLPISNLSLRLWTDFRSGAVIQAEALVDQASHPFIRGMTAMGFRPDTLLDASLSNSVLDLVRQAIRAGDDRVLGSVAYRDAWDLDRQDLIRRVTVKGRHGTTVLEISLRSMQVLSSRYTRFPQADFTPADNGADEQSINADIFPVYEETYESSTMEARINAPLKFIKRTALRLTADPYDSLRTRHYLDALSDPVQASTDAGRKKGYWSMTEIKAEAAAIRAELTRSENSYAAGGVILEGRYATINLHPDVLKKFPAIGFVPGVSAQLHPDWTEVIPDIANGPVATASGTPAPQPSGDADPGFEMIPTAALLPQPILSDADALARPAKKYPDNDPAKLINDGFDSLQVYYAITTLFEQLHGRGFIDPELSTRPFNAFLYDPDVESKDNAFYTDDTINFATYSAGDPNMARDNPTIWHELGHGVMDRLMGDEIHLADTGGLSEGMADFVAALVLNGVTEGQPFDGMHDFRIQNQTAFYLTNEVHDDGEAYGGAMYDLLQAAIAKFGRAGLTKVADLTMETMRFTRNHPALTAPEWFGHMLFADQLGNPGTRAAGELKDLITGALADRNFNLDQTPTATFSFTKDAEELTGNHPGTRDNPLKLTMAPADQKSFQLKVAVRNSAHYSFKFPLTVRVFFTKGALQGAIHWVGKEKEPLTYSIAHDGDVLPIDLTVTGKCDEVNRGDGSCVDYAYVQLWNDGETAKPQAKKRFYLHIKPASAPSS